MNDTTTPSRPRGLWLLPLSVSALALVVFLPTLATYTYPGESAHLYAQWAGLDALDFPAHPVWAVAAKAFAAFSAISSTALRLNLLSLVSGVVGAALLSFLVILDVDPQIREDRDHAFRIL